VYKIYHPKADMYKLYVNIKGGGGREGGGGGGII
jgi:hypothetical protein